MHLIIMGAPGSGKGTCCVDLKQILQVPHISTGDMFRKAIKDGTPLGKLAKSLIDDGKFVPDEVTNGLVKERLKEDDCKNGFILDGYPRNLAQAIEFDKILKELNIKLDAAINLDIDNELIVQRIINRRLCSKCGAGYNLISLKPKQEGICDLCGSVLYTRADDNEETVRTRLQVYEEQTKPLVEYFEKQGKLLHINATGSPEEVLKEVVKTLEAKC